MSVTFPGDTPAGLLDDGIDILLASTFDELTGCAKIVVAPLPTKLDATNAVDITATCILTVCGIIPV
ncbi:hypothetical protein [Rhodococcus ruber]|uniref:hypothetical protein n=1 Tax=Rhodococcus ruber TaxID=1830 RepID=UPI003782F782